MSTFQRGGWTFKVDMILTPTTPVSQRAKPSPSWSRLCPEARIGSGLARIAPILCGKAPCGVGFASPPSHGAPWRRTGGGDGGESDPPFLAAGAPRGRAKGDRGRDTLCPPWGEVALTTEIPTGRTK